MQCGVRTCLGSVRQLDSEKETPKGTPVGGLSAVWMAKERSAQLSPGLIVLLTPSVRPRQIKRAAGRIHFCQLSSHDEGTGAAKILTQMDNPRKLVGWCSSPGRGNVPDGPAAAWFFGYGQVLEEGHGHPGSLRQPISGAAAPPPWIPQSVLTGPV